MSNTTSTRGRLEDIAIVGVSALFPGSQDANGFWQDILAGKDCLSDVPSSHWRIEDYFDADPSTPDKTYAKRGGFLQNLDFDALAWGIPPSTLPATDTSQLLALVLAQQVLEDACGAQFASMDRSRISVILGVTSAQELLFSMVSRLQKPVWVKALRESGLPESQVEAACARIAANYVPWQEASFPGLLGNVVAGRIANRLNLGGTNCVTDAACASAFSAVAMAVSELQLGHSDMVITGGVDTLNDIFMYMCFSKTPALSPSGDCRPFSDQADGTMLGEGLGMVALKRLRDAEADGDAIYAVIKGVGTSSDGRSKSVYAPVAAGQAKALQRAYELAGYGADTVELMEAHGTGTKAGDAAEFEGLRLVFGAAAQAQANQSGGEPATRWCALGSVKSQIGHTKAAAGAAGLFKAVMALHHKILPPSIKINAPNSALNIDASPFYLNTRARPWISRSVNGSAQPRRASVSAFGFGGSNFHIALEEYRGPGKIAARLHPRRAELLAYCDASHAGLIEQLRAALAEIKTDNVAEFSHYARANRQRWQTSQARSTRLCLIAENFEQLRTKLIEALEHLSGAGKVSAIDPGWYFGDAAHQHASGELAFLFPGQGSQYPGMGSDLAMHFGAARAVWDQASGLDFDGQALHDLVFAKTSFNPAMQAQQLADFQRTEVTQAAIGAHSAALLAVLGELEIHADCTAGHSFGELMALHGAGVLATNQIALNAARARGLCMRTAASTRAGSMTALKHSAEQLQQWLKQFSEQKPEHQLVLANHNAPNQVVVSGATESIEAFERWLAGQGVNAVRLNVASAFHSEIVAGASASFSEQLQQLAFAAPRLPVFSNASATRYPTDPDAARQTLGAQLAQPVRFVEMIEAMYASGARTFVEVGPGQVLSGLVNAILQGRPHRTVSLDRKGRNGVESLLHGLAKLSAAGVEMKLDRLFTDSRLALVPERGKLSVAINGSNFGKPYPPPPDSVWPAPNPEVQAKAQAEIHTKASAGRVDSTPTVSSQPAVKVPETPAPRAAIPAATPQPITPLSNRPIAPLITHSPSAQATMTHLSDSAAWLAALQETQRLTAASHQHFQQTLADAHAAYLRLAESTLHGLAARTHATPSITPSVYSAPAPTLLAPAPTATPALSVAPMPFVAPQPIAAAPTLAAMPARAAIPPEPVPVPQPAAVVRASTPNSAPIGREQLSNLLLEVVAEKTGYPVAMLQLDMDLEGDLGVDSIKRVEILAGVDERAPELPRADRARLSALHTLREIVDYLMSQSTPTAAPATVPLAAPVALATGQFITKTGLDHAGLSALLLNVVAEKTGYPEAMLQLDMDLEGDLGVDSIKRVEILASVDERAPELPKVDRARLSALHTLAEIVDYLLSSGANAPADAKKKLLASH